jgi:hypothetical protein
MAGVNVAACTMSGRSETELRISVFALDGGATSPSQTDGLLTASEVAQLKLYEEDVAFSWPRGGPAWAKHFFCSHVEPRS